MVKKIILALLIGTLSLTLIGCGNKNVEGTLPEILDKINQNLDQDMKDRLISLELDDDNIANFIGTSDIDYKEAIASEHMTGSVAYSVVLIRAKENADIEAIKTKIKENINPRKWICVGVEKEEVIVKSKGDLIIAIVIASEENRSVIEKGFDNL